MAFESADPMDCDDVMLVVARSDRSLAVDQESRLREHVATCFSCRTLVVEYELAWFLVRPALSRRPTKV